jgi:hypothetical protein
MALAEVFETFAGPDAPVELTAYDGNHAGPAGSAVKITVRSPVAGAHLASAPGALGLARAYRARHPIRPFSKTCTVHHQNRTLMANSQTKMSRCPLAGPTCWPTSAWSQR